MELTHVMIAEDNLIYRKGLQETLDDLPGVVVSGAAANGQELLQMVANHPPQVVFTDIQMPVLNGIEATKVLTQRYPELPVLAITMHDDPYFLVQMLMAGARGYLSKDSTEDEFARALEAVGEGESYYCRRTLQQMRSLLTDPRLSELFRQGNEPSFSELELSLIQLTCENLPVKQIADRLNQSIDSVKRHRQTIMAKVGARNWAGVVFYATKKGLLN